MRTHNICLYKKVNKMYTGCNLKTTEFHECALIGVCAVIRSNTVDDIFLNLPRIGTICMKCQNLFSGKNKRKYFKMLSAENLTRSAKH